MQSQIKNASTSCPIRCFSASLSSRPSCEKAPLPLHFPQNVKLAPLQHFLHDVAVDAEVSDWKHSCVQNRRRAFTHAPDHQRRETQAKYAN